MPPDDYQLIVFAGTEDVDREYKTSFAWDRKSNGPTMAKVVKTILAMSNLRDGGYIVIGIDDVNGQHRPAGVSPDHLVSLTQDNIADFLRTYAEPYVKISVEVVQYQEGNFVVIRVQSFDETPVVCRTNYDNILSQGAIYIRSVTGRPQSMPVTHYVDMRRLLDLAIERGIRDFLERQSRVSPTLNFLNGPSETDTEKYDRELKQFENNLMRSKILERGFWRIALYPKTYVSNRIQTLGTCEQLVHEKQVRHRGWYFPHIPRDGIQRGVDYIFGASSLGGHLDSWRYHQSGLFVATLGLFEDWVEKNRNMMALNTRPGSFLDAIGCLFQITEVYEFAARLAQENVLSDSNC